MQSTSWAYLHPGEFFLEPESMPFDPGFTSSYLVAFIMGLFSSMHCIGMCGSIIGTLSDDKICF